RGAGTEGGSMLTAAEHRISWPLHGDATRLALSALALLVIGLLAMASASIEFSARTYGNPFFHVQRYGFHLALGLFAAFLTWRMPIAFWERTSWIWLMIGLTLLAVVLIPGIGRSVNGARRWLSLGPVSLQ